MTFLLGYHSGCNCNCYTSLPVNDYAAWGADVDCPQSVPTCRGLVKKNVCHRCNPSPGPPWSAPKHRLRLALPSLSVLEMVPRDNMSGHGRQIITLITLTEGPILTPPHTHTHTFLFSGTLRLGCISPPSSSSSAVLGAVTPFVKANVFLPDCTAGEPDTADEWFVLTCDIPYAEIWHCTG